MNLPRWTYTIDDHTPPWAMDVRHIDMLAAVVRLSGVVSAVEIGCLNGRSTTAFVEAVEAGAALGRLGLCDMEPTEQLRRLASGLSLLDGVAVEIRNCMSAQIPWTAELWMIDGNHQYEFVRDDVALARRQGAKVLVLHDTNHHAVDGPRRVLDEIRGDFPVVFHDEAKRPGEETERGMTFLFTEDSAETRACVEALKQLAK